MVLAIATGCGGDDARTLLNDAGGDDAGDGVDAPDMPDAPPPDLVSMCGLEPVSVDDWERCFLKRHCEVRTHCTELNRFTDAQECIDKLDDSTYGGQLAFDVRERVRAVADGRASIDVAAFTQCLIDFSIDKCNTAASSAACATRYLGTVANNQICFADAECASPGARCVTPTCTEACCAGTCQAKAKLGETCLEFDECEPGLVCNVITTTCMDGSAGQPCDGPFDCQPAAYCNNDTCTPDLAEGERCNSIAQCSGETSCVGLMRPVEPARCLRITHEGDACDDFCYGNLFCDLSGSGLGTCRPIPTLGQGCSALLPCLGVDHRCKGTCIVRDDVGDPCTDGTCLPGLFCTDQLGAANPVCRVRFADNATGCNQSSQCQSYICDGNATTAGDCLPSKNGCP